MLKGLITLVTTGTVALTGAGGFTSNLTEEQQQEFIDAREASVSVLTEEEVSFVESLDGLERGEVSVEQRDEVKVIMDKLHTATVDGIEDEEILTTMDERMAERSARRESGEGRGKMRGQNKDEETEEISADL